MAEALEARRALGLPPMTRLGGVEYLSPDSLQRIWARPVNKHPSHHINITDAVSAVEVNDRHSNTT